MNFILGKYSILLKFSIIVDNWLLRSLSCNNKFLNVYICNIFPVLILVFKEDHHSGRAETASLRTFLLFWQHTLSLYQHRC